MTTPYEQHKAQNHAETRSSPNGVNLIIECNQCRLAWMMPFKGQRDQNPVTLYHWMDKTQ